MTSILYITASLSLYSLFPCFTFNCLSLIVRDNYAHDVFHNINWFTYSDDRIIDVGLDPKGIFIGCLYNEKNKSAIIESHFR